MNITYDAYLGLYIGEPESALSTHRRPQQFYATSNLATQKWTPDRRHRQLHRHTPGTAGSSTAPT